MFVGQLHKGLVNGFMKIIEEDSCLEHFFKAEEVIGFRSEDFRDTEVVRFALIRPCGGKEIIDKIQKLLFKR